MKPFLERTSWERNKKRSDERMKEGICWSWNIISKCNGKFRGKSNEEDFLSSWLKNVKREAWYSFVQTFDYHQWRAESGRLRTFLRTSSANVCSNLGFELVLARWMWSLIETEPRNGDSTPTDKQMSLEDRSLLSRLKQARLRLTGRFNYVSFLFSVRENTWSS